MKHLAGHFRGIILPNYCRGIILPDYCRGIICRVFCLGISCRNPDRISSFGAETRLRDISCLTNGEETLKIHSRPSAAGGRCRIRESVRERKVRASQSRAPDNVRLRRLTGKCNRKQLPKAGRGLVFGKGEKAV